MQRVLVVVGLSHALMGRAPCPRSRRAVVRPLSTEAAQALLQERDVAMRDGAEDVAAAAYDAAAARGAVRTLAASADGVTLGIAAPTLASTLATLKAWTDALRLHRGTLFGADVDGEPVDVPGPIFLKYSPNGEARLRHDADTRTRAGVLFYPHVAAAAGEEVSVAQYLLPLALFDGDLGGAASMADAGAALTGKQKLLLRGRAVSLGGKLPTLDLPRDGATAPFLRQCVGLDESRASRRNRRNAGSRTPWRATSSSRSACPLRKSPRRSASLKTTSCPRRARSSSTSWATRASSTGRATRPSSTSTSSKRATQTVSSPPSGCPRRTTRERHNLQPERGGASERKGARGRK